MIKIAGTKSNDKINFKEFVDFFYKVDWEALESSGNKRSDPGLFHFSRLVTDELEVDSPLGGGTEEPTTHHIIYTKAITSTI